MKRSKVLALLLGASLGSLALPALSSDRGKEVAQMCAACHGPDGNATSAPNTPRLAGQPREFLALQLKHYASGERPHPVMSPVAQSLTAVQLADVAEWFAAQPAKANTTPPPSADAAWGERIFRQGKPGVPACQWCHGDVGQGNSPTAARLAGQHAAYLAAALDRYRTATELRAAPSLVMKAVVVNLSDAEVQAVAAYLHALR